MQLTKKQLFLIGGFSLIIIFFISACKANFSPSTIHSKPVVKGSSISVTTQEFLTAPTRLAGPNSDGFPCVRIPAIIKAPNGDLLAFWDGRPSGCPDAPAQTSIVMRRSRNGGIDWENATIPAPRAIPSRIVKDVDGNFTKYDGYTDPNIVVDYEAGKIFLFAVLTHGAGLHGGLSPANPLDMKAAYFVSENNGYTWKGPVDITQAFVDAEPNSYGRWASAGQGIQLTKQPHKGRLIVPFVDVVSTGNGRTFKAVNIYSDDHGRTWEAGQAVRGDMDENKVVELSDGSVLLNSRRSDRIKNRWVALSKDGGHSYT
ncbi:MAG: sialidase family protein, partial [Bacteroidia bacterium]|nr:sialidase family protein [Bacteroidia bacterium]